jgi:hypothetical protein
MLVVGCGGLGFASVVAFIGLRCKLKLRFA